MNDLHREPSDTQRPPPGASAAVSEEEEEHASFPVTVRCETEEQRAMLHDWLDGLGFETESAGEP